MAAVSEWIVREYFEILGFLVNQPSKHTVPGRQKRPEEEVDLLVLNPMVKEPVLPAHLVWETADLERVDCAVVGVRGWHTDRFYMSTVSHAPDLLRFADDRTGKHMAARLGRTDVPRILCIPRLPASGELKEETVAFLKTQGISGILTFATMLYELAARVDVQRNYEKSDLLQILRLLKNYDLLRDPQLELFGGRRTRIFSPRGRPGEDGKDDAAPAVDV